MLTDAQLDRYADVLLWGLFTSRRERYKKGDVILVQFDQAAVGLAEFLHAKLLDQGLNPVMRFNLTSRMERDFFLAANDKQLVFLAPGGRELMENLNGAIHLRAPGSLTHLSQADPRRIGKSAVARKPLRDVLDQREGVGAFGWTLCMLATPALAEAAKMSPAEYDEQIVKACRLDADNPVEEWKAIYKEVQVIKKWLSAIKPRAWHVESANTDLVIPAGERRKWIGLSGHNIPSFELFTAPDSRGAEGVYYADQPSYRTGNYVEGVRLEFRRGKAVKATADQGEEFVIKQLAMDKGASRLGEFSLTDKRFSRIDRFMANTLYDENFGGEFGNCHVAVGSSYSDCYDGDVCELNEELKKKLGFNDSALHWDLVNTENKRVTAILPTGERTVVYDGGMFTY